MNQRAAHLSNKIARKAQKAADIWAKNYWHHFPFGGSPRADRQAYLTLWEKAKAVSYPDIEAFETQKGFRIDPQWFHDLALHTQIVVKDSVLCYQHGRVLYAALREYAESRKKQWDQDKIPQGQRMLTILETGTARGFSAVCMARALADADMCGKIITLDLLPHDVRMYWNCIDDHEGTKTRAELLAPWKTLVDAYILFIENDSRIGIRRTATGRIHFAFLDGAHTYEDIMIEFDMVRQRQEEGDVIVFDDYNPVLFPGIIKGVDEGCTRWGYRKDVFGDRQGRSYVIACKNAVS
ncbi:MAG: class I SAM-dependent methyltransferase [Alphaproteobacteria bacterium CG_4_9_14_3_um_filter_47_13]|nr:MAG: class I SAM-dependent methyltransferase [Alphaproteobacteria bacterium CG_4_9_14_3_um_filter_47_13]